MVIWYRLYTNYSHLGTLHVWVGSVMRVNLPGSYHCRLHPMVVHVGLLILELAKNPRIPALDSINFVMSALSCWPKVVFHPFFDVYIMQTADISYLSIFVRIFIYVSSIYAVNLLQMHISHNNKVMTHAIQWTASQSCRVQTCYGFWAKSQLV